jgi:plastocyanin
VKAFAHYDGDEVYESDPVQITVTAPEGELAKPVISGIEDLVYTDQDLDFTVTRPKNAERMWIQVRTEGEDSRDLFRADNINTDTYSVHIDKEQLEDLEIGREIRIEACANARGYEEGYAYEYVTAFRADPDVVITADETKVYANTDTIFTVKCHDSTTPIEKLKIWEDDDGFWDEYVPGMDELVSFSEDRTSVQVTTWFGDTGRHKLFVRALFEGDPNWYTSEVITYEVDSKGEIGSFSVSVSSATILVGEEIKVTYSKADNAANYYLALNRYDKGDREWRWIGDHFLYRNEPGTYILSKEALNDNELEPGLYCLVAFANAEGYATKRAEKEVYFEVITKETAELREDADKCRKEIEGLTAKSTDTAIAAAEKRLKNLNAEQRAYLGEDTVKALEKKLQDVKAEKKDAEPKKTSFKVSATTVKKGKKTVITITADSGAKVTVTAKSKNAKNKKFVKIKSGKKAKLTFTNKAKAGSYKFTISCPGTGKYQKATKPVTIKVKK